MSIDLHDLGDMVWANSLSFTATVAAIIILGLLAAVGV